MAKKPASKSGSGPVTNAKPTAPKASKSSAPSMGGKGMKGTAKNMGGTKGAKKAC